MGLAEATGVELEDASAVKFAAVTSGRGDLLRSPVSGVPCVHWRLRIVEQVNGGTLQLVHEIASTEDFDVAWAGAGAVQASRRGGEDDGTARELGAPQTRAVRIRVSPQSARIEATPVLHRPGSPGAVAAGRHFGFSGHLSVEEVALRPGEEIVAEGFLERVDGALQGPFRGVERELELFEATVRLPARVALAPVLLPWALGTAAALLGGVGVATWAARRFDLLPDVRHGTVAPTAEIGPLIYTRRHFSRP